MGEITVRSKAWASKVISNMANEMNHYIEKLNKVECKKIISVAEQFTNSNFGWTSYQAKDYIVNLCKSRLADIALIPKEKNNIRSPKQKLALKK